VEQWYFLTWRNKFLTEHAETIGEMADALEEAARELRTFEAKGVVLEDGAGGDYARLVTTDPKVAEEHGFEPEPDCDEDDFLGEADHNGDE
jgi:hypothetical protein